MNYKKELHQIISIAREAGRITMQCRADGFDTSTKSDAYDFVTTADIATEEYIIDEIRRLFPDDDILSEESGLHGTLDGRVWMIDPIDGTKDFAHGGNMFSVMIGLCVDGVPVLGVVYSPSYLSGDPECALLYYATKGNGAYIVQGNIETRLQVSKRDALADARLVTRVQIDEHDVRPSDAKILSIPVEEHISMSSGGLKLGLIAHNQADLCISFNPLIGKWDTCAPQVILEEAGGIYTDGEGTLLDYKKEGSHWGDTLVASNMELHPLIINYLKQVG